MRYLDSNVFVYAAIYTGKKAENARDMLKSVVKGAPAITSSLVIDEVVWAIWKEAGRERAVREGMRMLRLPNLSIVAVDAKDTYFAMELMRKYTKLKPRDAIHLAVSINSGVFTIVSDDPDFDSVKEVKRENLG